MKILVCDDEEGRCNDIVSSIGVGVGTEPEKLVGQSLTDALESLRLGINDCIKDPNNWKPPPKLPFDDFDIVILDNNLAHLASTGARLTAEAIIGNIRAFTSAPYVISLNKNSELDFDLRFLVGDYDTRADVALNTRHLANPALWTGDKASAKDGFLPWYWPRLEKAPTRRREQIEFVKNNLDESVLTTLGFNDDEISFLSGHALGALSPKGHQYENLSPKDITFRHVFIARDRSLPVQREREELSKAQKAGNGSIGEIIGEIIARTVAADIDFWFRRDVIGPQEPLVDVPHLLMRFPFLLGDRANNINEWNKSASADSAPYRFEQELYDKHLAEREYKHTLWVPTPCFSWVKLKGDEDLNEYFFSAEAGQWADVVFCEDRSLFLERVRDNDSPVEFPAEFEGSWTHRYVSLIEGVEYSPRTQLAL